MRHQESVPPSQRLLLCGNAHITSRKKAKVFEQAHSPGAEQIGSLPMENILQREECPARHELPHNLRAASEQRVGVSIWFLRPVAYIGWAVAILHAFGLITTSAS